MPLNATAWLGAFGNAGRSQAMQIQFSLHQLGHSHNMQVYGMMIDPTSTAAALSKTAAYAKKE